MQYVYVHMARLLQYPTEPTNQTYQTYAHTNFNSNCLFLSEISVYKFSWCGGEWEGGGGGSTGPRL
jgi:hypothetical protein